MVSLKVVQLSHQVRKDGTCPILIRITESRHVRYIKTGFAVKPVQFRDGSENWVYKHNDSVLMNIAIEKKRSALFETAVMNDLEGKEMSVKKDQHLFKLIMDKLNLHELMNKTGAHQRLKTILGNMKKAGPDILISKITKSYVENYIVHLTKNGNNVNTIKKHLGSLSGILIDAEYTGKNYFKLAQKDFKKQETSKEKLTAEEIIKLEKGKLIEGPALARDLFLFSFYTHGMRFQDVVLMEEKLIKGKILLYKMNKSKKFREIEIHSKLAAIIKKYSGKSLYLFPCIKAKPKDVWEVKRIVGAANAVVNYDLKIAAAQCGVDKKITFHMARHSFAYLSLTRGVSRNILKDALGHSDFRTTEIYLKSLSDDDINKAVRGLYD